MRSQEAAGTNSRAPDAAIKTTTPSASFCLVVHREKVKGIIKSETHHEIRAPREVVRNRATVDIVISPRYIHARIGRFSTAAMYSDIGTHNAMRNPTSLGFILKPESLMLLGIAGCTTVANAVAAQPSRYALIRLNLCAWVGASCQISQAKTSS